MAELDGSTFLTGANAGFIAELYARFLDDPNAVDESWRRFFAEMGDDAGTGDEPRPIADGEAVRRAAADSIRALQLIRSYRVRGHLEARLDPLGLAKFLAPACRA